MTGPAPVRAVLVDADGVLQTNPEGWEADLRALVGARDGDAFVEDLFGAEQPAMRGERDFADVLREVCARWGIEEPVDELARHWRRVEVCAESVAVVRALRTAGTPCHLVSNQHAYRAAYLREDLGYDGLLDSTFFSCDLGVTKDDPAFFTRVADLLGVPLTDLLLVDDSPRYTGVGSSLGLRVVTWTTTDGTAELVRLLAGHGLTAQ